MADRQRTPTRPSGITRVRVLGTGRWRLAIPHRRLPRLIAVGAARSGAGKSVVASNLAVAIAGLGTNVVLVDMDLGAPRLQSMFGITRPAPGLDALLSGEITSLDAALTATAIRRLHLITGARQTIDRARKRDIARQIQRLEGDVVVVDIGASSRDDLFDLFSAGALCVLASNPDRLSLESTFGFLASAAARAADRYGADAPAALARFRGRLVGNRAETPEEADSFHAFSRLVHERLGLALPVLGCLRTSGRIAENFGARRPLLARTGHDDNVRALHDMAELLMSEDPAAGGGCDLSGERPLAIAEGSLPPELGRYLRKHTRYPVDWTAALVLADRVTDVRVADVSYSGAAIEAIADLKVGDRGLLHFSQIQGQPVLRVVVKHILPALRRIGVAFLDPGEASSHLVAAARATHAA